ncbi:hypothetical protein [Actinokineospora diospyrosa]|uniref:hypothetical protein n=1 Tax=Actinokineospora diospyrosa TaxID=103728 RepID=UPI0020A5138D|nr:hypothetical protein [Actinokineospora diospyrosa]
MTGTRIAGVGVADVVGVAAGGATGAAAAGALAGLDTTALDTAALDSAELDTAAAELGACAAPGGGSALQAAIASRPMAATNPLRGNDLVDMVIPLDVVAGPSNRRHREHAGPG